jgi:hypothetical protein
MEDCLQQYRCALLIIHSEPPPPHTHTPTPTHTNTIPPPPKVGSHIFGREEGGKCVCVWWGGGSEAAALSWRTAICSTCKGFTQLDMSLPTISHLGEGRLLIPSPLAPLDTPTPPH